MTVSTCFTSSTLKKCRETSNIKPRHSIAGASWTRTAGRRQCGSSPSCVSSCSKVMMPLKRPRSSCASMATPSLEETNVYCSLVVLVTWAGKAVRRNRTTVPSNCSSAASRCTGMVLSCSKTCWTDFLNMALTTPSSSMKRELESQGPACKLRTSTGLGIILKSSSTDVSARTWYRGSAKITLGASELSTAGAKSIAESSGSARWAFTCKRLAPCWPAQLSFACFAAIGMTTKTTNATSANRVMA
mmetsp:Transcript_425/g.1447  ORF Transcript_425/g.1447 Transcript_425/m.1447 type:complete len:245 (-) Transcript_425:73-807(-)